MWQAKDASPENSTEFKTKRMRRQPREEKDRVLSRGHIYAEVHRNTECHTHRELKASQGGWRAEWQGEYEQVGGCRGRQRSGQGNELRMQDFRQGQQVSIGNFILTVKPNPLKQSSPAQLMINLSIQNLGLKPSRTLPGTKAFLSPVACF